MTRNRKIIFVLIPLFLFFIGYTLGSEELPFNETLKFSYNTVVEKNDNQRFEEIDAIFYQTDIENMIDIDSEIDIIEKRKQLIDFIWKDGAKLPTKTEILIEKNISFEEYEKLPNLERIDKHEVSMEYNVNSVSYLFLPKIKNNSLVIYHQGHAGDFSLGYKTIEALLENNYSVLAFSMPLQGKNNQPTVDIENVGVIRLEEHNNFHLLDSEDFSSIKFFMNPIVINMNYLEENFDFKNYHMIGISGGAWATTLYSAIDERIEKSFPTGGPLPRFLIINVPGHSYEYERDVSELYDIANYLELFILGSYGDERKQLKILNKYDSCCYYGISYQIFENTVKEKMFQLDNGSFDIFLDDTHREHKISEDALSLILEEIT